MSAKYMQSHGYLWAADYVKDESGISGRAVMSSDGYPGDLASGQYMYQTDKRTTQLSLKGQCGNGGPTTGDADVMGGMSGGPLWINNGFGFYIYGTLFGAFVDGNGNELQSIHANGPQFVQGVNNLNSQNPA